MYHGGPAQAYLSRATSGNLTSYKGDGEWFKIGEYAYLDQNRWAINGFEMPHYIFVSIIPDGKHHHHSPKLVPHEAQSYDTLM